MCELLCLSPKIIKNMVSQHLVSLYIPSNVLQRNLITLELGSNSGDDFQMAIFEGRQLKTTASLDTEI